MRGETQETKARVCVAIDEGRPQILAWGERVRAVPELGFKEAATSLLVREAFDSLGIPFESPLALTGVRAGSAAARGR